MNSYPKRKQPFKKLKDGRIVVFPYFLLNKSGSLCYQLATGNKNLDQIASHLCKIYKIKKTKKIIEEIKNFYDCLFEFGLISYKNVKKRSI